MLKKIAEKIYTNIDLDLELIFYSFFLFKKIKKCKM